MTGLWPTGTVASTCAEADSVDGVGGVAVGVGGQGGGGAERDIDDGDGAGRGPVAGVGYDQLGAGGREVCPDGRDSDGDGGEGVSSWLVWELTTLTVLSVLLRMKERLPSAVMTP